VVSLASAAVAAVPQSPPQVCYRHNDRRAGVRCQRCDRPICPACMHQASVGFHCPECARGGRQKVIPARALATKPVATYALVAANLAIFIADTISSGRLDLMTDQLGELGRKGALFGPAVAAGDWWRPITSGFLHIGLFHVGFNMYLLYLLGSLLEPAIRKGPFLALYFLSLLGGSFAVLVYAPNEPTVGASGAVFGLMAAAFVALRSRGIDPFSTGIGTLLLINIVFTFAVPGISRAGHIGGLLAGAAGGAIIWWWTPRLPRNSPLPMIACIVMAVALYAGCLAVV
jgi:membrane associated rhomboid family serine protease